MNRHRFRFLWLAAGLTMLLGLPAGAGAGQEARIGVIHWEQFAYAKMMKNSYEMAAEDVNRAGGVNGKPVELVYADDKGDRRGEKRPPTTWSGTRAPSFWWGGTRVRTRSTRPWRQSA